MFVRLMEVVMLGHVNMEYQQVKEGCEKERERERERERVCKRSRAIELKKKKHSGMRIKDRQIFRQDTNTIQHREIGKEKLVKLGCGGLLMGQDLVVKRGEWVGCMHAYM